MADDQDDVFEYGDQTTFRLRDQEFLVDDFGTVANIPTPEVQEPGVQEPGVVRASGAPSEGGPETRVTSELARIEEKLDAVLHGLEALQRRVDSIDAMIARVLTR